MPMLTYPPDLSDGQWRLVASQLPRTATTGRPRQHPLRATVNAMVSLARAGDAWRVLPRAFPPWKPVSHSFRQWRRDGTWLRLHTALRDATRVSAARPAPPHAAIIDRHYRSPLSTANR